MWRNVEVQFSLCCLWPSRTMFPAQTVYSCHSLLDVCLTVLFNSMCATGYKLSGTLLQVLRYHTILGSKRQTRKRPHDQQRLHTCFWRSFQFEALDLVCIDGKGPAIACTSAQVYRCLSNLKLIIPNHFQWRKAGQQVIFQIFQWYFLPTTIPEHRHTLLGLGIQYPTKLLICHSKTGNHLETKH